MWTSSEAEDHRRNRQRRKPIHSFHLTTVNEPIRPRHRRWPPIIRAGSRRAAARKQHRDPDRHKRDRHRDARLRGSSANDYAMIEKLEVFRFVMGKFEPNILYLFACARVHQVPGLELLFRLYFGDISLPQLQQIDVPASYELSVFRFVDDVEQSERARSPTDFTAMSSHRQNESDGSTMAGLSTSQAAESLSERIGDFFSRGYMVNVWKELVERCAERLLKIDPTFDERHIDESAYTDANSHEALDDLGELKCSDFKMALMSRDRELAMFLAAKANLLRATRDTSVEQTISAEDKRKSIIEKSKATKAIGGMKELRKVGGIKGISRLKQLRKKTADLSAVIRNRPAGSSVASSTYDKVAGTLASHESERASSSATAQSSDVNRDKRSDSPVDFDDDSPDGSGVGPGGFNLVGAQRAFTEAFRVLYVQFAFMADEWRNYDIGHRLCLMHPPIRGDRLDLTQQWIYDQKVSLIKINWSNLDWWQHTSFMFEFHDEKGQASLYTLTAVRMMKHTRRLTASRKFYAHTVDVMCRPLKVPSLTSAEFLLQDFGIPPQFIRFRLIISPCPKTLESVGKRLLSDEAS